MSTRLKHQGRRGQTGKEQPEKVAPPKPVSEPAHRKREQTEGDKGTGREAEEGSVIKPPFGSDGDHRCGINQEYEVIERVRCVDEGDRTAREEVRAHERTMYSDKASYSTLQPA